MRLFFASIFCLLLINSGPAASLEDIKHVIVIMQENRSFDHYFADLGNEEFYGDEVDVYDRQPIAVNSRSSPPLIPYPQPAGRRPDPAHGWGPMWRYYNNGDQNRFSQRSMVYYTKDDLPYYYDLANTYAISDRYFSSVMGPTHPNRSFLLAGTSYGLCTNFSIAVLQRYGIQPYLILDALDARGLTWGYYTDGKAFINKLFGAKYVKKSIAQFNEALSSSTLPDVVFLDAVLGITDEHPTADPITGSSWVQSRIASIQNSATWDSSVIFLTYDECGGFYDHVKVPSAVIPDDSPMLKYYAALRDRYGWDFNRYGFRVPFMAISPFSKTHYVSHEIADHTSVLRFIEKRFDIPPLGNRDAVAHDLMDLFEFENN